jgi:hypothetical protein
MQRIPIEKGEAIMSKEKMVRAQQLIREKRYDDARIILRSTNHHQAAAWLAKLDEIDPPMAATFIEASPPAAEDYSVTESLYSADPAPLPSSPAAVREFRELKTEEAEKNIPMPVVVGCLGLALLASVCVIGAVWAGSNFMAGFRSVLEDIPTARSINYGVQVNGTLSEENFYLGIWSFEATAGDQLVITMRSNDFDSLLSLFSADFDLLAEDDDSGGGAFGTDSQIVVTIPDDGRYTIYAERFDASEAGGAYTLSVDRQ